MVLTLPSMASAAVMMRLAEQSLLNNTMYHHGRGLKQKQSSPSQSRAALSAGCYLNCCWQVSGRLLGCLWYGFDRVGLLVPGCCGQQHRSQAEQAKHKRKQAYQSVCTAAVAAH